MSSGSHASAARRRTRRPRRGRGSAARCGSAASSARSMSSAGGGSCASGSARARRADGACSARPPPSRSVGCEAITSSRPGGRGRCGRGRRVERLVDHDRVRRFSHERISAVEMLRGPDHIASRTRRRSWRDARPRRRRDQVARTAAAAARRPARGGRRRSAPVDRAHRHHAGERAGHERLAGAVDVGQAERRLAGGDAGRRQTSARSRG